MSGSWEAMIEHEEFLRRRELARLSKVQLIDAVLVAERRDHGSMTKRFPDPESEMSRAGLSEDHSGSVGGMVEGEAVTAAGVYVVDPIDRSTLGVEE